MLENINLKRKLSREEYKRALPAVQHRLYDLEKACWDHGVPAVIVFEGWDASGKGTAIAALTQRLDPRGSRRWVRAAIAVPLPEASQPSKTITAGTPWSQHAFSRS